MLPWSRGGEHRRRDVVVAFPYSSDLSPPPRVEERLSQLMSLDPTRITDEGQLGPSVDTLSDSGRAVLRSPHEPSTLITVPTGQLLGQEHLSLNPCMVHVPSVSV